MAASTARSAQSAPLRYGRWMLASAGLLLVLLAGLPLPTAAAGALPSAERTLTLGGISTLSQSFVAHNAELIGVRVWLRISDPTERDLRLTLRLRYATGLPTDLVTVSLPAGAVDNSGALTFRFPALRSLAGPYVLSNTLLISIDVPPLPATSGPQIALSAAPYLPGDAFIDDSPRPNFDLAFQPIYQQSLIDRIWPLSRMAAGKPGLLGWPPFYLLVAYTLLLFLSLIFGRVWRYVWSDIDAG